MAKIKHLDTVDSDTDQEIPQQPQEPTSSTTNDTTNNNNNATSVSPLTKNKKWLPNYLRKRISHGILLPRPSLSRGGTSTAALLTPCLLDDGISSYTFEKYIDEVISFAMRIVKQF